MQVVLSCHLELQRKGLLIYKGLMAYLQCVLCSEVIATEVSRFCLYVSVLCRMRTEL